MEPLDRRQPDDSDDTPEARAWYIQGPIPADWRPGWLIYVAPRPCFAGDPRLRRPIWRVEARDFLPLEPYWTQRRCRWIRLIEELPATAVFGPRGVFVEQVFGTLRRMSAVQAASLAAADWPEGLEAAIAQTARSLDLEGEADRAQGTAYLGVADQAEDLGGGRRWDRTPAVWAVELDELWSTVQDRAGSIAKSLVVADGLNDELLAAVASAWSAAFPEQPLQAVPGL